jgi:hypothetical protein
MNFSQKHFSAEMRESPFFSIDLRAQKVYNSLDRPSVDQIYWEADV